MNKELAKLKEENKRKKIYSRVLTNSMTIVGHKLFKSDRQLHLAFMIYRLRRDFGFTAWEIANLTGIPTRTIYKFYELLKPILNSEILKTLSNMDYEKDMDAWYTLPSPNGNAQGYYRIKDYPAWYAKSKKWSTAPSLKIGEDTENKWLKTEL